MTTVFEDNRKEINEDCAHLCNLSVVFSMSPKGNMERLPDSTANLSKINSCNLLK